MGRGGEGRVKWMDCALYSPEPNHHVYASICTLGGRLALERWHGPLKRKQSEVSHKTAHSQLTRDAQLAATSWPRRLLHLCLPQLLACHLRGVTHANCITNHACLHVCMHACRHILILATSGSHRPIFVLDPRRKG